MPVSTCMQKFIVANVFLLLQFVYSRNNINNNNIKNNNIFKKPFYYLPTVNTGEWAMRQAIEGKMASDLFDIFQ